MDRSKLLIRYGIINQYSFEDNGDYFNRLLEVAMKLKAISLKEGVECNDLVIERITDEYYMRIGDLQEGLHTYQRKDRFVEKHLYILSKYLYSNFTPAEALLLLMQKPVDKIYESAIKYYVKILGCIIAKLKTSKEEFKKDILIYETYKELLKRISETQNVEKHASLGNSYVGLDSYITMNYYKLDIEDIIDFLRDYADAFTLEVQMLNKFGIGNGDLIEELINYAYGALRKEYPKIIKTDDKVKKRRIILKKPKDIVLKCMFNHYKDIEFSDAEMRYIENYFIRRLQGGMTVWYG